LCGDGDEDNSNFTQLLYLRAVDQPQLLTWLKCKTDKYTSPQVQNELFTQLWIALSLELLARLLRKLNTSLAIMADEVTDSSNKEQVVICLRIVDEQFEPHKEFVGMYQVDSIKSSSIVEVLKDTIVRLNLALSNC